MKNILSKYKNIWNQKEFRLSLLASVFLLILSLFINHRATTYADVSASNYVTDMLLDNIPTMDVDGFLNYGVMAFSLFVIYFILAEPKKIPFFFKSFALFVIIRSAFVTLTHLGPVPGQTPVNPNDLMATLILGKDYFFSGHTGIPFLIALIFWDEKIVRYVSLLASVLFGASVIVGHLHYSIDVFSAFFITYTIFKISQNIFPRSFELIGKKGDCKN